MYDFMEKKDLRDSCFPRCFPSLSHARHSILCSELKQLYVAITRTRQRLWICEDSEEFAAPMFDFWKKLGLVQVKEVDESFSQTMLMASSPAEWKSRGIKVGLLSKVSATAASMHFMFQVYCACYHSFWNLQNFSLYFNAALPGEQVSDGNHVL